MKKKIKKLLHASQDIAVLEKNIDELEAKYSKSIEALRHLEKFETMFAPGHFYSPYPDLKELRKRKNEVFGREKKNIEGIDIREEQQLELLKTISKHYKDIPYSAKKDTGLRYFFDNDAYSYTDAIVLFCMLNHLRPKQVIEIGSGYSSALMIDTNERFMKDKTTFTFIEPYPELLLSLIKTEDKKHYTLIDKNLSKVSMDVFKKLNAGDILFIDSTHVSKAGSDVNQIFFEILPALKKGVVIHIHDVFYPFEYPHDWIEQTRAWNEDYLLRAFLHNNKSYEIMFFNHFMNIHHSAELTSSLPWTKKNMGGSLWLRKVA